jgi:hypothetical protein
MSCSRASAITLNSAEKARAVLVTYHVPVRKTHSIGLLLDLISEHVVISKI